MLVLLLSVGRDAFACENEVLGTLDPPIATLKRAERALEDDDLDEARKLAAEVANDFDYGNADRSAAWRRLHGRARRVLALVHARDPGTSADVLAEDERFLVSQRTPASPATDVAWAEVAARVPRVERDAYIVLEDLAERDLVGSAYAYAALARLAERYDDDATMKSANAACLRTARDARICRGERARPVFLRAPPLPYVVPLGLVPVVAVLLVKRARRRRSLELRAKAASSL